MVEISEKFVAFSEYMNFNFRDILPKMIHTNWFGKGQKISKANYDFLDSPKKKNETHYPD